MAVVASGNGGASLPIPSLPIPGKRHSRPPSRSCRPGFLGVGVPPYMPSSGNVIASGKNVIREAFWVSLFPGVALTVTGLSLNLLGDGLRDTLDPRLRGAQAAQEPDKGPSAEVRHPRIWTFLHLLRRAGGLPRRVRVQLGACRRTLARASL